MLKLIIYVFSNYIAWILLFLGEKTVIINQRNKQLSPKSFAASICDLQLRQSGGEISVWNLATLGIIPIFWVFLTRREGIVLSAFVAVISVI